MDERGGGEPREQRRVLDRVPAPEAAPAEHRVAPPRAEHDADREEAPRDERRTADRGEPSFTESSGDERGDREGERDREADVARVEERRVDRDERMVLQQRVRARTVERDRAGLRLERVRGEEHQREEEQQHSVLHQCGPRDEWIVGTVAEAPNRDRDVHRQQECPQQDRPLERAPCGRERVETRCARATLSTTYLQREVVRRRARSP